MIQLRITSLFYFIRPNKSSVIALQKCVAFMTENEHGENFIPIWDDVFFCTVSDSVSDNIGGVYGEHLQENDQKRN